MANNYQGRKFGNYRLTERLGYGDVYLGKHTYLDTQVAIKILHDYQNWNQPNLMEDLRKEALILGRLKHPNIIQFIEFGTEDDIPYLVMSYAANGTIGQKYPNGTSLPIASVIVYVRQIASALHYIHKQDLIYNAIKPENMLIDENSSILLSDFSITVSVPSDNELPTNEIVGTAAYMAPEQFRGYLSQSIDLYALGTVVYEWLSGTRPFSETMPDIMISKQKLPPLLSERIPSISPMVENAVMKALDPDPNKRFRNVMAFANALEQASRLNSSATIPKLSTSPASSAITKVSTPASGVKIFLGYAREDELLLKGLEKHLSSLKRQGLINVWHDQNISAGTEWEREVSKHLNEAQIILLLVSPDFMDSDYCYGIEMKRAMERHERGEACVIPIILRHVYWKQAPFSKLQVLPKDAKPVLSSSWHNLDEAFFDVIDGIQKIIEKLAEK